MGKRYSVPDKLGVILRPETSISQDYTGERLACRPAFVTDFYAEYMLKKAREWGAGVGRTKALPSELEEVTVPNDPLTRLVVTSIVHRREGGVALKVITEQGWLVDLREPEFMEAALTGTLHASVITGEFVWSRGITQMRLVRVGSQLHTERLAFGNGV